jgi:hypothetical protein
MSPGNSAPAGKDLENEVRAALVGGYLPCPVALRLADRLGVATEEIGYTADSLGVRITGCQLGCFKIDKATRAGLEDRVFGAEVTAGIGRSLVNGRLPCPAAHALGHELGVPLTDIGDAATRMGVKIVDCQLNCFV